MLPFLTQAFVTAIFIGLVRYFLTYIFIHAGVCVSTNFMLLCEHITLFVKTIIVTRAYVLACIYAYQQVPCNW